MAGGGEGEREGGLVVSLNSHAHQHILVSTNHCSY